MGGAGYSVRADWQILWNEKFSAAQFALMNEAAAIMINTVVTGNPTTDVANIHTATARKISDDMMEIFSTFLKESSMADPPEFIHYKIPHFTPLHLMLIRIMKKSVIVGKLVF